MRTLTLDQLEAAIPTNMSFRGSASRQFDHFRQVVAEVNDIAVPEVGSTHTSKSIELPVMRVRYGDRSVCWLDNFHELDIHYSGPVIDLSYEECGYTPYTAERYREEMAKAAGYSWSGWSEEEILDERITRVRAPAHSGGTWWNQRSPDQKARWIARLESADWFARDWSGGALLGDVPAVLAGSSPCLWHARRAFTGDLGPYTPESPQFSLVFETCTVLDRVGLLRKLLVAA